MHFLVCNSLEIELRCMHRVLLVYPTSCEELYESSVRSPWLTVYRTSQVGRQMGMRIFSEKFYKNGDISGSLGRISMRFVSSGVVIWIFVHAKREVWENSVARERPRSRFGVMSLFLEKVLFARRFSMNKSLGRPCRELSSCNQCVTSQNDAFVVHA